MHKRNNKIVTTLLALILSSQSFTSAFSYSGWADTYIQYCVQKGIISGDNGDLMPDFYLTREQMAKILIEAFEIDMTYFGKCEYEDVLPQRWSYQYISKYQEYVLENTKNFNPAEPVTREEFLAMTVKLAGYSNHNPQHEAAMQKKLSDYWKIDEKYYRLIVIGYENGFITGSDGELRPKDTLTRAEACAMLYRVLHALETNKLSDYFHSEQQSSNNNQIIAPTPVVQEEKIDYVTPLVGPSEVTLEQAKQWARNRGAHERFINIADLYWQYGELTGIRADVMYAQAAKETNFGKYTGQVKPEQNNWAGIKKYGATGDEPQDHEDFLTPEDGVRGHFNHMSAYVGLSPIGEPHGRYKSVKSLSWAGTVKMVEELGGKWCPTPTYGVSIMKDYVEKMKATKVN